MLQQLTQRYGHHHPRVHVIRSSSGSDRQLGLTFFQQHSTWQTELYPAGPFEISAGSLRPQSSSSGSWKKGTLIYKLYQAFRMFSNPIPLGQTKGQCWKIEVVCQNTPQWSPQLLSGLRFWLTQGGALLVFDPLTSLLYPHSGTFESRWPSVGSPWYITSLVWRIEIICATVKLNSCGEVMASLHKAPYRYTQYQHAFHQLGRIAARRGGSRWGIGFLFPLRWYLQWNSNFYVITKADVDSFS